MFGTLKYWILWALRDEGGFLGELFGGLLGTLFGGGGGQQAQANRLGEEQVAQQRRILDYLLRRREGTFDPLLDEEVIPRLTERVGNAPFYARDALRQARNLRQPMRLS